MGKLFVKIIVFVALFLVMARLIGVWDNRDREVSPNPNITRIANAHRFDSLDILFVGSSSAYSGINPLFFDSVGLRTYNMSVAAAGPYFYSLLVDDYLRVAKKKPVSIYLLFVPSTFMRNADDFTEIGIHRYLQEPLSNEAIASRFHLWTAYPQLLLKSFQKGMKNRIHLERARQEAIDETVRAKGFYRSEEMTSTEKEAKEHPSYAAYKQDVFNTAKLDYLVRYADSLQKQGMHVLFFTVPGNKMDGFYSEEFINEYREAKNKLQTKYAFIDASTLQLDSTCFRNSDHLNSKGAAVVSRAMIDQLRNNSRIAAWYPSLVFDGHKN